MSALALSQQLVHYEQLAAALEEKLAVQKEKLEALWQELDGLCREMEDPMDARWDDVVSNLSDQHMADYVAEVRRTTDGE